MHVIETAWKSWFEQFAPYVFTDGEIIDDPQNILYPRITYSFSTGAFLINVVTTFQVWDWNHNNSRLWEVCGKISAAVPAGEGAAIPIPGEIYHEYRNPDTGQWVHFSITDFQAIADELAPNLVEWRRVESEHAGEITVWRGNPFLTPSPKNESRSRAAYGTLLSRYRTTL